MLSNLLKPSLEGQKNLPPKDSINSQNTLDTLSSLPATHSTDVRIYYSESSSAFQLLHHSLNHSNVEWLEKQLSIVQKLASSSSNSEGTKKSQQYTQNLDQLSEKTSQALQKISLHRRILQQKLIGYLLLKSKQTNRKNLIRSNMFKYKSALLVIKSLKQRKIKSETQVTQLKSRLKTSGLLLVPSLIQKSLTRLALDSMTGRECPIQITEPENLRFIVDNFMSDRKIINEIWSDVKAETHELYLKFKMYILLKNCIGNKKTAPSLDKICQEHIRPFYANNLNRVTETEHNKIRGLVQCDPDTSRYLQNESISHLKSMFGSIYKFVSQLQIRASSLHNILVNQIIGRNKKVNSFDKLSIPSECVNLLLGDMSRLLALEQLARILSIVEDRKYLFQMYASSMGLKFNTKDLQEMILSECAKFMLDPIKKIFVEINKLIYKDKKEKHYHNTRIINKSVMTWALLIKLTSITNKQLIRQLEQHTVKENVCWTNQIKKDRDNFQAIKGCMSVGQFMAQYNEMAGQTFMYIANKLANLVSGDKKLGKYETTSHPFSLSKLTSLWLELISEGICNHLLHEAQPANILKHAQFLQDELIDYVEGEYRIEAQLDKLYEQVHIVLKGKKKLSEQCVEQTYMKILELNLKARNHSKIMSICKEIKVEEQMKSMNEEIYTKIVKSIIA